MSELDDIMADVGADALADQLGGPVTLAGPSVDDRVVTAVAIGAAQTQGDNDGGESELGREVTLRVADVSPIERFNEIVIGGKRWAIQHPPMSADAVLVTVRGAVVRMVNRAPRRRPSTG